MLADLDSSFHFLFHYPYIIPIFTPMLLYYPYKALKRGGFMNHRVLRFRLQGFQLRARPTGQRPIVYGLGFGVQGLGFKV